MSFAKDKLALLHGYLTTATTARPAIPLLRDCLRVATSRDLAPLSPSSTLNLSKTTPLHTPHKHPSSTFHSWSRAKRPQYCHEHPLGLVKSGTVLLLQLHPQVLRRLPHELARTSPLAYHQKHAAASAHGQHPRV
ncbi:hypothetical protein BDN72DRAFT_252665 [Pluteus cervinus]|uniref:Uncharacterized protein n=1 Tax=Pluteus cervinus TaxID=181527 RepID=A0ACD3AGG2_9AGAR|nr:hypothetical protein BDN72DRAFT_252665 [Pluteus cervinus]